MSSQKLNEIGFEMGDEWTGAFLLAGLPDDYRPMIMALENSDIRITGDTIKVKLLQETKSFENVKSSSDAMALFSKEKIKNRDSRGPKCYACNNYGDIASNCRSKFAKNNSKTNGNNKTKNEKSFVAFLSSEDMDKNKWYIDSVASCHITN
ncbi:uncharacterized protein [Prorops nasuta]|uniref:uncharacterized protein n=1 Tax=Prorops nasuta TaxID=863751 RepID=UPI0034CFB104